jgi:Homeodomain-like domain
MNKELISMTSKELTRLEIIQKVKEKRLKQYQAAEYLNLSLVQVKRLYKQYKKEGAKGLVSKKRGSRGNHRLPDELKQKALDLIWDKYPDFGPTLAQEKLLELDHLKLSVGTIRNLMIQNSIWEVRKAKKKVIHQMRERRSKYGELIQIDGSPHDWFEGKSPKCSLIVFVDDATSKLIYLKFENAETTWAYLDGVKSTISKEGIPQAYYSDRHGIFKVNRPKALSGDGMTQFGRIIKDMGIKSICATTPQAKGRVERVNRVLQDRLVKELRLNAISTIEEANAFLPSFMEKYNQLFAKEPKSQLNAHKKIPQNWDLDLIFRLRESRYLSKNLTFQYNNKLYQIKTDRPTYALRKARVDVFENKEGNIIIEYKNQKLLYTIYEEHAFQGESVSSKELNYKLDNLFKKKHNPSKKHPWRSSYNTKSKAPLYV